MEDGPLVVPVVTSLACKSQQKPAKASKEAADFSADPEPWSQPSCFESVGAGKCGRRTADFILEPLPATPEPPDSGKVAFRGTSGLG